MNGSNREKIILLKKLIAGLNEFERMWGESVSLLEKETKEQLKAA